MAAAVGLSSPLLFLSSKPLLSRQNPKPVILPSPPIIVSPGRAKAFGGLPPRCQTISGRSSRNWAIFAASGDAAAPSDAPVDTSLPTISTDDGSSTIITLLFFVAFVALSVLTIGVIYIAVSDFLQKREKEKFEKEEAAKVKKGGKKKQVKARAGPRGFGQKIDEDDE